MFARNWGALVVRGIFAIAFGVLAFLWPGITLEVLVLLFGAYALMDGIFAIVAAMDGQTRTQPWWALVVEGMLGIGAGVATFAWPGITALVLLYIIAFWAVVTGLSEVIAAMQLRRHIDNEWALALSGILSLVFGAVLFLFPGAGALTVVWIIGAYAIFFGILLVALGLRLRSWRGYAAWSRAGSPTL